MDNHQSKYKGLTPDEVIQSRQRYGENRFSERSKRSHWAMYLDKLRDPIVLILIIAMFLSLTVACYEYFASEDASMLVFFEPLGVLLAILLSTGIAFYFELKSEREFALLNEAGDEESYKVVRGQEITHQPKHMLVVGDIVLLETGEEVPADGLLLEARSLVIDESSLTGEPQTSKTTDPAHFDAEATYPSNYLCRGTKLLEGYAVLEIKQVGDATEQGKIFEGVQLDDTVETPLNRQLDGLSRIITRVSYLLAALILGVSILTYSLEGGFATHWSEMMSYFLGRVMIAVTIIVVAVPEGLPMSVTLSLAYSMRSMMRSGNLVRRLHACETMGAATVICTDKTGTLTQNRMRVASVYRPEEATDDALLYEALATNTTAYLDLSGAQPEVLGNPTEGALLLWLEAEGQDYLALRHAAPLLTQLPFSTERKYMASWLQSAVHTGEQICYVKGAPEVILAKCRLRPEVRSHCEELLTTYQARAMRTLAIAYTSVSEEQAATTSLDGLELGLLALYAIADPIREEVPDAIARCRKAGIEVKVITGDTSGTAKEIARQIGLWDEACGEAQLITGSEFAALSDEELRGRLADLRIMSRARPSDKERLVRLLQEAGEVVAVTGDGTNDAPALRRAHVGLSMGDGTAVAKEASDITILDSSFASIVLAVLWGRSLHLNIQRFLLFQMTINLVACLIVLIGALLGTESPLTVTQMLWVNLIMDTFAALALASLPPSPQLMDEQPRSPEEPIITASLRRHILLTGAAFLALLFLFLQYFKHETITSLSELSISDLLRTAVNFSSGGELSAYELSLFFSGFVLLQFWNMFNAKSYHSGRSAFASLPQARGFLLIAGLILIGQYLITELAYPFFQIIPLGGLDWLLLILATSFVLIIGELARATMRLFSPAKS